MHTPAVSTLLFVLSLLGSAEPSPLQVPFNAPLNDSPAPVRKPPPLPALNGRFLHLTDMHPDPHYRVDGAEKSACHRRKPKKDKSRGGYYGLAYGECDSPYTLTNYTLDHLEKHWAKELDFVIWTGDTARHDNDDRKPRTPDEIYALNRAVAARMDEVFAQRGVPVVPTLGNNDVWPHNIMLPGPNAITNEFAKIWKKFIPFESFQVFQRGGYYSVEVIPNQVAVISLNTMYFYDSNKAVSGCEYTDSDDPGNLQLDWLEVQLDRYRTRGLQVWLSGHVPPSPGNYYPGCFVRYADTVLRYQDTILGQVFGHMNVDHFFFLHANDTILWDDEEDELRSRGTGREEEAVVGLASKNNLAKTIMEDFGSLPKKADLDDYAVVNVGPSVVPHPYLPTFRVFAYNISGTDDQVVQVFNATAGEKKEEEELNEMKRKHGHRNPNKKEVDCKKKEHRETWACRRKKPQYASPQAPSRMNRLWTPLGYAQYWLPDVSVQGPEGEGSEGEAKKPKWKLEYTTFSRAALHPEVGPVPIPLKELPKSLREKEPGAGAVKDGEKYVAYGLGDLTIGSWLGLARRLGDESGEEATLRKRFRKFMYQSV